MKTLGLESVRNGICDDGQMLTDDNTVVVQLYISFRSEPFRGRENNSEFRSVEQK
jgi:hypothetical protein